MSAAGTTVEITVRIPGAWGHPGELLERLPEGFRLTPDFLVMPDGTRIEFNPMAPDQQFAEVFETACRRPATDDELAIVARYTVNIALTGPGGSMPAALTMMQAAAAIVRAGGAGVFIDNSALSHGGGCWTDMADDGGPDALSFAFVSIVRGRDEVYTMGMHVLGFPEIRMRRADLEADGADGDTIIDVIRYICTSDKPIGEGHILADEHGPRFQASAMPADALRPDRRTAGPMHNPFGCLRLTNVNDIAKDN